MRLLVASYKQSKQLVKIKYEEYCHSSYIKGDLCWGIGWKSIWKMDSEHGFKPHSPRYEMIPAPLIEEVFEWLRRNFDVYVRIDPSSKGFAINFIKNNKDWLRYKGENKPTYGEAQKHALTLIIRYFLIKHLKKNKRDKIKCL